MQILNSYTIICLSWDSECNYAGKTSNKKMCDPLRCEYSYSSIKSNTLQNARKQTAAFVLFTSNILPIHIQGYGIKGRQILTA